MVRFNSGHDSEYRGGEKEKEKNGKGKYDYYWSVLVSIEFFVCLGVDNTRTI